MVGVAMAQKRARALVHAEQQGAANTAPGVAAVQEPAAIVGEQRLASQDRTAVCTAAETAGDSGMVKALQAEHWARPVEDSAPAG